MDLRLSLKFQIATGVGLRNEVILSFKEVKQHVYVTIKLDRLTNNVNKITDQLLHFIMTNIGLLEGGFIPETIILQTPLENQLKLAGQENTTR